MRQQEIVLAIKCERCGANFDLWQDLIASGRAESKEEVYEALNSLGGFGNINDHFCWKCRQVVNGESEFEEPEVSELFGFEGKVDVFDQFNINFD